MKRTLLIINTKSATAQTVGDEEIADFLRVGGFNIVENVSIPDSELPLCSLISDRDIEVVAILSGDGTISSLCQQLDGWPGEILVLPGGTMNLLSRRLNGELNLRELFKKLGQTDMIASTMPVVCVGKRAIFTGLTVGPSTRWGEVREDMRHGDVAAMAENIPAAWSKTMAASRVYTADSAEDRFSGIFVEPFDAGTLSVIAFRANNLGDMLGHGVAWLRRDFREGPHDDLGIMPEVTILGDEGTTGLLVDGEIEESPLPLTCSAGMTSVRFLRMVG